MAAPTYAELFAGMKRLADPHDEEFGHSTEPYHELAQRILFGRVIDEEEWWSGEKCLTIDELLELHGVSRDR